MPAPTAREMIDRLIAIPSVSSVSPAFDQANRAVIDELASWLEDDGWDVRIQELAHREGKANLVARLGPPEGGLVLSGHTDTVPFDEARWSSDPFRPTERDGRLYGLGTTDMKAFLALAIEAARAFDADALAEPVWLLATADEECGMDGIRGLVADGGIPARRAVIGEPTNNVPVRLHKGASMEFLALEGRSGHASQPALGVNALDGMVDALGVLREVMEEVSASSREPRLDPPHATLNLGRIEGGDNPNRICARCRAEYDVRLLPGMDMSAIRDEVRRRLDTRLAGRGLGIELGPLFTPVPPFETPADARLVQALEAMTSMPARGVSFATEAPYLTDLGIETVVLGPGDIAVAHQPDEYLELDRVGPTVELLRGVIWRFCVEPEG
ncbi:MAG: acetylornithine deacetylase [Sandaracinaceae bacterium]